MRGTVCGAERGRRSAGSGEGRPAEGWQHAVLVPFRPGFAGRRRLRAAPGSPRAHAVPGSGRGAIALPGAGGGSSPGSANRAGSAGSPSCPSAPVSGAPSQSAWAAL